MSWFQRALRKSLPGVHIQSIKIGSNAAEDFANSYFMHPDLQIEEACRIIKNDSKLADGFNGIGLSQGSQFLRGLLQRCSGPRMKNFISLGGQHQGVYGLPHCPALTSEACDLIRKLLNNAAYTKIMQHLLVQATYWHDPLNENEYETKSTFLSDINNELVVNETYKKQLQSLDNFVMVKFEQDSMVQPIISEWFGFYSPGQSTHTSQLNQSLLYKEDRLGLKEMNDNGKLHFYSVPGDHLEFTWEWFTKNIINNYLK